VLKVRKDHHLTDAHDVVIDHRNEHVTASTPRFADRLPIALHVPLVFGRRCSRSTLNHERGGDHVVSLDRTNAHLHTATEDRLG
jgi:hypothetical protein